MKYPSFAKLLSLFSLFFAVIISGCSSDNDSNDDVLAGFIDDSSNPYEMHFVSASKAYVLRYGSPSIWIVDPSVSSANEEEFKIGEINLKAYDADGVPNMSNGLIHDGRLYVVMQAMDASYVPGQAYMAVIDIATDTEINVDSNPLKAFELEVVNPVDIDLQGDFIYVTGIGRYGSGTRDPEYTGGIEKVNINDFTSTLLIDDGDAVTHPYGQISGLSIISDTQAYFTAYAGWQNISLYEFNLSSGEVTSPAVENYVGVDIRATEVSPEGYLWVALGDFSDPLVDILDPSDNSVVDSLSLDKNPTQIHFNSDTALIVSVASDYTSSELSLADAASPYAIDNGYAAQDLSDIVGAIDETSFYRLGRTSQNNISKFDITSPSVLEWQFSTNQD